MAEPADVWEEGSGTSETFGRGGTSLQTETESERKKSDIEELHDKSADELRERRVDGLDIRRTQSHRTGCLELATVQKLEKARDEMGCCGCCQKSSVESRIWQMSSGSGRVSVRKYE